MKIYNTKKKNLIQDLEENLSQFPKLKHQKIWAFKKKTTMMPTKTKAILIGPKTKVALVAALVPALVPALVLEIRYK